MQAVQAYNVGMKRVKKSKTIQYTIRSVPDFVDKALRARAKKENKSLNQVALDVIQQALISEKPRVYHDLDFLIGTWVEDPEFDKVMAEHEQIDEDAWR